MIVETYKEIVGSGWENSFIVQDCGGVDDIGEESFAGAILEPNDTLSEVKNFLETVIGLGAGVIVIDFYQLIDETSKEINEKIVEIKQIIKKYCKDYEDTKSYEFRASYCRKDILK